MKLYSTSLAAFLMFALTLEAQDSAAVFTVSRGAYNDIGSVVFPEKMNVFYIGVENSVHVSVPGVIAKDIGATLIGEGVITNTAEGKFVVTPQVVGKLLVCVQVKGKEVSRLAFRVKRIPDPFVTIGGKLRGGQIRRELIAASTGIVAVLDNFDFDARFSIRSFSMQHINGSNLQTYHANGPLLSQEMKNALNATRPGDVIIIDEVIVVGPDSQPRKLTPISFTVI